MQIIWARLIAWLAAAIGLTFGAWEVFLTVTFMAVLAVCLYGVFLYALNDVLGYVLTSMRAINQPASSPSFTNFVGFTGWMLSELKVPQCIAFIVDIILLKWALRKIPFVKW
jgi:hypothetical protein